MKLKKNICRNETPIFFKNVDTEKVSISNKIFFGEKNCKYFIGYLYNNNKVKSLHIMLLKQALMLKVMMDKLFLIEDDD